MASRKGWKKLSMRQKYILGHQIGALKPNLTYEQFKKTMTSKKKKK